MVLNLKHWLVREHFGDEFGIESDLVVGGGVGCNFIEEFAEIIADGQINQHLLVKCGVVVAIDGLHIFELGEVTERVSIAHEILNGTVSLQALNDVDDILDLVAVEHASEELIERVGALANQVLNLSH